MAKRKKKDTVVDFPFYVYLQLFYSSERKRIVNSYKPLTKKFLAFNDPDNTNAFLRRPQFEALEMYIFLKEFCNNEHLAKIFEEWYKGEGVFAARELIGIGANKQTSVFGPSNLQLEDQAAFETVFEQIKRQSQPYPNYIFALTMGLGKTVLMATSIFYEFLLANKYPKDEKYCHNALVFAPDKTVLQSLREIQTFDKSKVVPPEYVNWLETNLKFFFLDETGDALNAIDRSNYNIIISNTQKIILKKQHKEKSPSQMLFEDYGKLYKAKANNKDFEDLYSFEAETEADLIMNQRFAKLTRIGQLGIYVDEAHHVFGNQLAKDFGLKESETSLRKTINELSANLEEAGTHVVGCYNYTGTPYVGNRLLPEVVYAFGLKESIDNKYLKKVTISEFKNIKDQTLAFVRTSITDFWKDFEGKRYEGMLPKMAFFSSTVEELQKELRPAVEQALSELNIPMNKILVNVGDSSITTNDDLREFKNLDTISSEKQFILLVNKGKEGWNCRSLFAVGLHREPKSKIFVLQATMRCLRAIGDVQETGKVFLSEENVRILDAELTENFHLSLDEFRAAGAEGEVVHVRPVEPTPKIKLRRIRKLHQMVDKKIVKGFSLELDKADTERYKIIRTERTILDLSKKLEQQDVSEIKDQQEFSELTLVAEIARYIGPEVGPIRIREILESTEEGIQKILSIVNEYNEMLYDWVIPHLFKAMFDVLEFENNNEEYEVELVKPPKDPDYYTVKANKSLMAECETPKYSPFKSKSFHLDHYCFDSNPESQLFWTLLQDKRVDKVWFTGMLTHGQTDFVINYIDPVSHTVRSYYPDFLVQLNDESYVILEVKGDNMIDDEVVRAKADYATQIASASKMTYKIIKGSDAMKGVGV